MATMNIESFFSHVISEMEKGFFFPFISRPMIPIEAKWNKVLFEFRLTKTNNTDLSV